MSYKCDIFISTLANLEFILQVVLETKVNSECVNNSGTPSENVTEVKLS